MSKGVEQQAAELAQRYVGLDGTNLLEAILRREFPGRVVAVSAFGAESALLLALIAEIDRKVPVVFLETGKHFEQTQRYRDQLVALLGLQDIRLVLPDALEIKAGDPAGTLWQRDADACCRLRKVWPLERALADWPAWITGRKAYQGAERAVLPLIEAAKDRIKINPLATWSQCRVSHEIERRGLPRHPLEALGYRSIGCAPCSRPVRDGEAPRAGRWSGQEKTECGIHWSAAGQPAQRVKEESALYSSGP